MRCLNLITKYFPEKFLLNQKTAVVTGGAGLLGKQIAIGLAQAGAKVFLADIDKKKGEKIAQELVKSKLKVSYIFLDISDETSIKDFISKIIKSDKKIDVWVNCAYPRTDDWNKSFEDISTDSWKKNIDMHLNGYVFCCKHITKHMKKQKSGSIINFSSIYGIVGPDFSIYSGTKMTMPAAYAAIKGGIVNFTRYLATYFGKDGIRVNAICPGGIKNDQPKDFIKNYSKKTPLGRMGEPHDIVGPVLFLASDASSYVTGHILVVDGGWTTW